MTPEALTCRLRTVAERLEVPDELDIFVDGCFFRVNGPSEHVAAELHVVLSWRTSTRSEWHRLPKLFSMMLIFFAVDSPN